MLLDVSQSARTPTEHREDRSGPCKYRIRFRKDGLLRLVSHHDLMHCVERMLRRANLPLRTTQGYHPKPKLTFALSLALGVVGCEEVLEVELQEFTPSDELSNRLRRQTPPGLEILDLQPICLKSKAHVVSVGYRLDVSSEEQTGLKQRLNDFLDAPECWVERTRPKARRMNIRPFVRGVRLNAGVLELEFWVCPSGTPRPEEALRFLGIAHLLNRGSVLQRTKVELLDELNGPDPRPQGLEQTGSQAKKPSARENSPSSLLPGPLSFDT